MLPVSLPEIDRLSVKVAAAKAWHDKASKVFVRKGFSKLLEVFIVPPPPFPYASLGPSFKKRLNPFL
jgi:hypothetical protein